MTVHNLNNGNSAYVTSGQWNGDSLVFAGTSSAPYQMPTVSFSGPDSLTRVSDVGTATATAYGTINLTPGGALTTGGLTLRHGVLSINERPGTGVTFNGTSQIGNASALTATGYAGMGKYTVNGTMNIDGTSTVSMDSVAVSGTGTFHLTGNSALLRVSSVTAGETVVLDGGMLSIANGMQFLGTITNSAPTVSPIGSLASVDVYNAIGAASGTFSQGTGMLNLYTAQGGEVASLKFAGTGKLYAAPTTGLATNYMAISSHPSAGMLPITYTS